VEEGRSATIRSVLSARKSTTRYLVTGEHGTSTLTYSCEAEIPGFAERQFRIVQGRCMRTYLQRIAEALAARK